MYITIQSSVTGDLHIWNIRDIPCDRLALILDLDALLEHQPPIIGTDDYMTAMKQLTGTRTEGLKRLWKELT